MKNNTEIDYRNAIKAKYETEKSGSFHGFLENPSPAQLRELCLLKFDNGLNKIDEGIFRIYFKISETDNLREAIYNYHIPKFKSIGNFLAEENKKTNIQNLNLIAVVVDFNPRPFNKFSKGELSQTVINEAEITSDEKAEIREKNKIAIVTNNKIVNKYEPAPNINSFKKKLGIGVLAFLGILAVGYTTKDLLFPEKDCMQWQNDHYELVDCKSEQLGISNVNEPKPFNEVEFKRKKLEVCDTTRFFMGNKAIVWYSKENNVVEFFNMDGVNPETGDELKKITEHMIEKYVLPCK